jgi:hypothetical protein
MGYQLNSKVVPSEKWTTAEEIWKSENADCKDFATCVYTACLLKGFPAEIVLYYSFGYNNGHAIVVGVYQDKIWMSSNGGYRIVDSQADITQIMADLLGTPVARVWVLHMGYPKPMVPVVKNLDLMPLRVIPLI